jgi:hypothetical protein
MRSRGKAGRLPHDKFVESILLARAEAPKKCLVSTMQVLLQGRRLTVAKSLAFAPILVEELLNFQVKITESANETFGTWREGGTMISCAAGVAENAPVGRLGMSANYDNGMPPCCYGAGERQERSVPAN